MSWSTEEHYFSGQGVVLMGTRDAAGRPQGLRPVGNVPALALSIDVSTLEHKESTTGQRGTDLRLTQETNCAVSITMENFKAENLAAVSRGEVTEIPSGSVTDEPAKAYKGLVTPLRNIKVSSVVVKQAETVPVTLDAYTNDLTAYDYRVNTEAGSLMFNDGKLLPFSKLGKVATVVGVGATTSLTVPNSAKVGEKVYCYGFAGDDATAINGKWFTVLTASSTVITIDLDSTGKDIDPDTDSKVVCDGIDVLTSYSYAAQSRVDGLTAPAKEVYLRFEGLNTAKENEPVVVEIFRVLTDPFQELALIGDEVQSFVLEGSAMADNLQLTGSKYFKVTKLG